MSSSNPVVSLASNFPLHDLNLQFPPTHNDNAQHESIEHAQLTWTDRINRVLCLKARPKMSIGLVPLPLATCFVLLTAIIVWIYIMMRRITTSSEKFEAVPCYIVALQLLLCAGVMCLFNKESFRQHRTALKFAGAIYCIGTKLLVVAIVSACWLAEKQERYNVCLYDYKMNRCACRRDENTKSDRGWWIFEAVVSCSVLDQLYHWQIVTITVHSVAVFVCIVSVLLFYQLWLRARHHQRNHHMHPRPFGSVRGRADQGYPSMDWDAWLYSQSFLQRFVAELRHIHLPPSYDVSEQDGHPTATHTTTCPPPAYADTVVQQPKTIPEQNTEQPFVTILQINPTEADDKLNK